MAKAAKPKKEISMEEALWKSADKLRGSVEPAEYKHVVLSLFFLKFASDKFEDCRRRIIEKHGERFADMKPFYAQENVFYLPEESRWSYIIANASENNSCQVMPPLVQGYFSRSCKGRYQFSRQYHPALHWR